MSTFERIAAVVCVLTLLGGTHVAAYFMGYTSGALAAQLYCGRAQP